MSLAAQGRIPVLDIGAYLAGEAGAAALLATAAVLLYAGVAVSSRAS